MKIKRIIAAFMAATVCGAGAVTAGAKEFTSGDWHYSSIDDGHFYTIAKNSWTLITEEGFAVDIVAKSDIMCREELVIPSEVNGIPVIIIGNEAFKYCYDEYVFDEVTQTDVFKSGLQKIYIPSSVKHIYPLFLDVYNSCENPFKRCTGLTDVFYGGSEADWYESMEYDATVGAVIDGKAVGRRWDGRFAEDSNLAYDGIEKVTLHVNCKDINDEGTVVNFGAKVEKPAKVAGIKKARSRTYIKLSWKDSKGAESYVIKYSTDKKTWKTRTVKTNSVKLSKLKAGTKYYIKVAAKNSSGTSAYSKVFSVTTKTMDN